MSRKKSLHVHHRVLAPNGSARYRTFEGRFVFLLPIDARAIALLFTLLAAVFFTAACGKKVKPRVAMTPRIGATETGIASWYGHPYHGRRAANGEIYDMERLTAAHRTLPFETWVDVLNLSNGKNVMVRITDRGPFIDGRIIDLSRAAANQIDLIGPGITQVRVTVVTPPRDAAVSTSTFAVQIGAFRDRSRAERLRADYERTYGAARLLERPGEPPVWRVLVGNEDSLDRANALRDRIVAESREPAFVVRFDQP